jgi:protein-tyrosine phosphatase
MKAYSILFVCRGNTCRSPMMAGMFAARSANFGTLAAFQVASAGIAVDPASSGADPRAMAAVHRYGIDLSDHRCRSVVADDFASFDLILAADNSVLTGLHALMPQLSHARVERAMAFAPAGSPTEIADPWTGTADDYTHALDLIRLAVDGLLQAQVSPSSNGKISSTP